MAASVVASIALPISNNFSFAPSMDAYGKLSEYGKLGAWSPLSLFAASEVGAWYDPSDLTTMFQDSAGTTPVTADGQPVGKILDKSGRGNHATQATAASRPLYKTDGTYHWLQFDGVDDSLITANIDFTSTTKMSVFAGLRKASDAAAGQYFETSTDAAAANPGALRLSAPTAAAAENYGGLFSGATALSSGSYSGFPALVKNVVTTLINCAASGFTNIFTTRINQTVATPSVGANGDSAANFGNYPAFFGSRNGLERFNGNIYSLIVRGALSTADEITATETWVAAKTGVTL